MKKKISIFSLLVFCFLVCSAAIVDLSGKWSGAMKAPNGRDYPVSYLFKVTGDNLTGSAQGDKGPTKINDGKINGADISFNIVNQNGALLGHTGKYFADGDSIAMDISYNGRKMHATLKRVSADK